MLKLLVAFVVYAALALCVAVGAVVLGYTLVVKLTNYLDDHAKESR